MAYGFRQERANPAAHVPQLLVSTGCSVLAFTGVWLWWFGRDISHRVSISNSLTDPYAPQLWMRRLHTGAAYVVAGVIALMVVRAAVRRHGLWRIFFLVLFLLFMGIGFWAGYEADWNQARIWSETAGSKMAAGITFGDGPRLPDVYRDVRVHLAIVPAALVIVAIVSFYHYRRN